VRAWITKRLALLFDADTVTAVPGLPAHRVVRTGDKFGAGTPRL